MDREAFRLRPLVLTILANRLTLVVCLLWGFLIFSLQPKLRLVIFAIILCMSMVEKASRMAKTLSMQHDWVPTMAHAHDHEYRLTHLNTIMCRIDISFKFIAPLIVSSIVAILEPKPSSMVLEGSSAISLVVELLAATRVWKRNRRLQARKYLQCEPIDPGLHL